MTPNSTLITSKIRGLMISYYNYDEIYIDWLCTLYVNVHIYTLKLIMKSPNKYPFTIYTWSYLSAWQDIAFCLNGWDFLQVQIYNGPSCCHYNDVIMSAVASQITNLTSVYSTIYSGAEQKKLQSPASMALLGEFTGDQWIPRTKGKWRGTNCHVMTSS